MDPPRKRLTNCSVARGLTITVSTELTAYLKAVPDILKKEPSAYSEAALGDLLKLKYLMTNPARIRTLGRKGWGPKGTSASQYEALYPSMQAAFNNVRSSIPETEDLSNVSSTPHS